MQILNNMKNKFKSVDEAIDFVAEAGVWKDKAGLLKNIYTAFKKEVETSNFTKQQIIEINNHYKELKSLLSWHNFDTLVELLKIEENNINNQ